jgi:hypothetical protein
MLLAGRPYPSSVIHSCERKDGNKTQLDLYSTQVEQTAFQRVAATAGRGTAAGVPRKVCIVGAAGLVQSGPI